MKVGAVHWGSRKIAESRSRMCGSDGVAGSWREFSFNIIESSCRALDDARSGNRRFRAFSIAGIKSRRWNGEL